LSKLNDFYHIPSGMTSDVCDIIKNNFKDVKLKNSTILFDPQNPSEDLENPGSFNPKARLSKQTWIATDHWIAGMMSHFIHCANNSLFEYDLCQWSDQIQYTVYDGKNSHYSWHQDSTLSNYKYQGKQLIRKLSISLCLSSKDDYEGGEFQIMHGPKQMQTLKLDIGDVVVFPSDSSHRIRPLKSGKRISLVGWFAGPKFK